MKITWHIVKKDFRRLQVPLVFWALLLVAQILIGVRLLHGDGDNLEWFGRLGLYGNLFFALDLIVTYVLVAMLIHDDPLVGSRVFWLTRPISGARLLGAKLLGIVLMFGVLPVLIWLPWWLACGYGWPDIATAVFETLVWKSLVVVPALMLAVLTDHFSRYLTSTLALFMVLVLVSALLKSTPPLFLPGWTTKVAGTRVCLELLLIVASVTAVVSHQFLTRKIGQSLGLGSVGLVLVVLTALLWRWDLTGLMPEGAAPSNALTERIAINLDRIGLKPPDPGALQTESVVTLKLTARGVPDELGLMSWGSKSILRSDHTLSWRDGATLQSNGYLGFSFFADWIDGAARRLLGVPDLKPDSKRNELILANQSKLRDGRPLSAWIGLPDPLAARMAKEPPSYWGKLSLLLVRPEVEYELPLRESDRQRHRTSTLRIAHTGVREDGRMFVNLVESTPDPRSDADGYNPSGRNGRFGYNVYALINHARTEAEFIWGYGAVETTHIGTVEIRWNTLAFPTPRKRLDGQWVSEPPTWFEGATLARVGLVEETRFSRELKVERFEATP